MAPVRSIFTAFSLVALCVSSEVAARKVVIDQGEFMPVTDAVDACTIGIAGCTATTLPFSFDFGTGLTNQAYIYDRGIISFGAEIPIGVDATDDFTTFGVPVIAPLYVPGTTGTPGPYEAFTGTLSPTDFEETLPNFGTDLFVISFLAGDPNSFPTPYINVILDASATELRFEFLHGQSFLDFEGNLEIALPDTTGTQLGYSLGAGSGLEQVLNDPPDIVGINAFTFPGGPIPEPATWAMMLLGFGAIGLAFRRRKAALAPALVS